MSDQAQEKQHEATTRRIEDLRRKGQSMRSRDLTTGLVFIVGVMMIAAIANQLKLNFENNFVVAFTNIQSIAKFETLPHHFLIQLIFNNFFALLPLFILILITVLLSPFIFGGWNFTLQAIRFNVEKLNPIVNLGNIFSTTTLKNVVKSFSKVTLIVSVLMVFCYVNFHSIYQLSNLNSSALFAATFYLARTFVFVMASSLVLIILYDVVSNFFIYQNKIKMTTQELKDEHKDTEGNVEVKRKIRSQQFALLKQRLSLTVPKATVIITNPTHYAIAIKYDERKDHAPTVVAKGKDYMAQQIRQLAIANHIPIYEAPPLARAIYHSSKLNAEINSGLYMAVAIVLSYVNQLKKYQHGRGPAPYFVHDLKIPDELIYHE